MPFNNYFRVPTSLNEPQADWGKFKFEITGELWEKYSYNYPTYRLRCLEKYLNCNTTQIYDRDTLMYEGEGNLKAIAVLQAFCMGHDWIKVLEMSGLENSETLSN